MIITNGQSSQINGSTLIDLQAGLISLVPIYLEAPIVDVPLVLTLANPSAGSLVQVILFNQSGQAVSFKMAAQDSLGGNIPVIMSNLGSTIFFSKTTVNVQPGAVYSVIGGLVVPDNILFVALR